MSTEGLPMHLSPIGLGTYLGEADDETDLLVEQTVQDAIQNGINVIDTAINYRYQRAERAIGRALKELFARGQLKREEIFISTKGGFIPFDSDEPQDPMEYFQKTFIESGIMFEEELVAGCHSMSPRYIQNQIDTSLANLGLKTIDLYYIHNPETQLNEIAPAQFHKRIKSVFETLEKNVAEGKIKIYGTATWNGYRVNPKVQDYLSFSELIKIAHEVGGPSHHFRAIQLPYNLAMPEALLHRNQELNGEWVSILTAAQRLSFIVMSSASLLQGRLAGSLPSKIHDLFPELETPSQKAIQFVRSTPGITTALVGMKSKKHLEENAKVLQVKPQPEAVMKVFE